MNKGRLITIALTVPMLLWAFGSGPDPNSEGGPGGTASACAQAGCHTGLPINLPIGQVQLQFPGGLTYVPGVKQRIKVVVTASAPTVGRYGFQLSARLGSNETRGQAGRFDLAQSGTLILCGNGQQRTPNGTCSGINPVEFIEHSTPSVSGTFEVEWTPPASDVGSVKFYVAGMAADGNGTSIGDYTFTANATITAAPPPADGRATLTAPTPGSALSSGSALFTWTGGINATNYWLDVGNSIGKGDISAGATTSLARGAYGLPTDGRTVYARLWTFSNGAWQTPIDYTFTACNGCAPSGANLHSHTPGLSVLAGSVDTFGWNATAGATKYWLDVGTQPGFGDIHAGETPFEFKEVSNLPVDGRKVYLRIWSYINNAWAVPRDFVIDSCTNCAARLATLQTPRQGATLNSTSVTFSWSVSPQVTRSYVLIGYSKGRGELWNALMTIRSVRIDNIPADGRQIYVTVQPYPNGSPSDPSHYSFTACNGCSDNGMHLQTPEPGSKLTSTSTTFNWSAAANATKYWLEVGNTLGTGDISGGEVTTTSRTVNNLPVDGRILYVRLFPFVNSAWGPPKDYIYEACSGCTSVAVATLTAPAQGSTLSASSINFTWNAVAGATNYWLDVGNSKGVGDISAGATAAVSKQVSNIPTDGRPIHARLWTFVNGAWQTPLDYTFTACNGCTETRAMISRPASGTVFTTRTATFEWGPGAGVTQNWLDVGTVPGQGNIFGGALTTYAKQVTNLPANGAPIYVALWSYRNGAWQPPINYTYTACNGCPAENRALLTAPVLGTPLTAGTINFTWSAGTGATAYWLDVGNSIGDGSIAARNTTGTSATVTVPRDGRMLYIRLWTFVNGAWQTPFDYTLRACTGC